MYTVYIDQYRSLYSASSIKELKSKVCPHLKSPRTAKMYIDKKNGDTVHCGYIISDKWLTAYLPLEKKV